MMKIFSHKLLYVTSLSLCLMLTACSDDTVEATNKVTPTNNNGNGCADGQTRNQITGECVGGTKRCPPGQVFNKTVAKCISTSTPVDMDIPDMPVDAVDMPATDGGGETDSSRPLPDMKKVVVDVDPADKCKESLDSDGDGLNNKCECDLGTDSGKSDTDDDGLPDGYEDANMNCQLDGSETQPTIADTDSDGISDGDEVTVTMTNPLDFDTDDDGIKDGVERDSCTEPLNPDTDGDGIEDGREDTNRDGFIGICQNRMYDPVCAQGEYDPCKADTDGDGTEDGQEANFLDCRQEFLDAIPNPTLLDNMAADYRFAIDTAAVNAPVASIQSHAFNHEQEQYAGFVLAFAKPIGNGTIEQQREAILSRVRSAFAQARFENNGRRTLSHDNFDSISRIEINLGAADRADTARDRVLVALSGAPTANHGLSGNFISSADNQTMVFSIIDRGNQLVMTAAFSSKARYDDKGSRTGFLMDDVGSPNSVAKVTENLESACTAYEVDAKPKADFLWILDGSGSMDDKNERVKNNMKAFTEILQKSNIDWRLGVTSASCDDIQNDGTLPAEVKAFFGSPGLTSNKCPDVPEEINIPLIGTQPFGSPYENGKLCGNSFTTSVNQFTACADQIIGKGGSEFTATIATAALARLLPRTANTGTKLRPDAVTVVISVTDEFDDLFQGEMEWRDAYREPQSPSDPSTDGTLNPTKLEMVTQPFVDYLRSDEVKATMFSLIWIPGQQCVSSNPVEAAAGIETLVNKTGGTSGNICADDLTNTLNSIAQASAGLASGLRLQGTPVTPSIQVRVGDVVAQQIKTPARSRIDGWDYDVVTNAALFIGPTPPKTKDRVVITYKRWENSAKPCKTQSDCKNDFQKLQCREGICI